MVTIDDVRVLASRLPRSYEALVQDRVKFRVGRIVYLALSRDETLMGFALPKEEREALVTSDPHKFLMPLPSDMRFNWAARVRLVAIDVAELSELVLDAWQMAVPRRLATPLRSAARRSGNVDSSTPVIEPAGAQGTVPRATARSGKANEVHVLQERSVAGSNDRRASPSRRYAALARTPAAQNGNEITVILRADR